MKGKEGRKQGWLGSESGRCNRRSWLQAAGAAGAGAGLAGGLLGPSAASAGALDNLKLMRGMSDERKLDPAGGLSVLLLGTGVPIPSLDRMNAATMIIAGNKAVLVDCGAGAVLRLAQSGIRNISLTLFTHFHSDHVADFGLLLMNRFAFAAADAPLAVIGPEGVKDVADGFARVFERDKRYRVEHHEEAVHEAGYAAEVTESAPGVVYDADGLRITMFEVDHKPVVPAVGYKFEYQGKTAVVSGDTVKVPQMAAMAEGCDILVHEALNKQMIEMGARRAPDERGRKMALDLLDYHTPTNEVAEIAAEAGVKKLVLTHMVPSPINRAMEHMFTSGMHKIYRGPIIAGRDGLEIKTK